MKKTFLYILFCAFTVNVSAQTLSPAVLSPLGSSYLVGGNSISGTMGQTSSTTLQSSNNKLSQGFEQPELSLRPTAYAVTGGTNCGSTTVGVANSQTGDTYQLYLNATTPIGSSVSGTGSAISFTLTNPQTTAGTYTVIGTDTHGNTTQMTGSAIVNANPVATAGNSGSSGNSGQFCSYDNISLSSGPNSMTTYSWSNSATTQNPTAFSAAGNNGVTYVVTVTDNHGCTGSASTTVTVNVPATTSVNPNSPNPCSTDITPLTASGSGTYVWSPFSTLSSSTGASVNASPSISTTYTVTGTDAKGCTSTATSAFTVRPVPVIIVTPPSAVCTGQVNSTLVASGAVSYIWNPTTFLNTTTGSTVTAQISVVTFYTVTGTGSNGCTANSAAVPVATVPVGGSIAPAAVVICSGGTTTLTSTGAAGHDYQWQISSDNINWTNLSGATNTSYTTQTSDGATKKYYRQLANSNACYNIASTTSIVDISTTPAVTVTNVTSTTATVTWSPFGSGQYNISWSGAAGSGSASALTTNIVTIGQSPYGPALNSNQALLVTVTPVTPVCAGVSPSSASTHTLCASPIVTNVSATTFHGFLVNWTAVGGASAYRVYYRDLSTSSTWSYSDVTGLSTTINVLFGGHTFAVYVAAKDCPTTGDIGDASTPLQYVVTNPLPTCSPVPTVITTSSCPNQITITISGSTPPYNLELRRISPSLTAGAIYTISSSSINITVGTQYAGSTWEVFASRSCGTNSASVISNVSIVTVKPGCPVINNLVLSHPTCYGFTASWNSNDCSGLGISGYQLLIKKDGALNYTGYPVGSSTVNYAIVGWLIPNTLYDVIVVAVSCNGATSAYSNMQTISSLSCGREATDENANGGTTVGNDKESVLVYPNPTQGQFWVNLGSTNMSEQTVKIELINQLGQVVQTNLSQMTGGQMNQLVNTPEGLATGIYFVRTSVGNNVYVNRLMISGE